MNTVISLSEYLGLPAKTLDGFGVFETILGVDSRVFLDPALLRSSRIPEFRNSYSRIEEHFRSVVTLISASERRGDRAWNAAAERLRFRELRGLAIGYGRLSGNGNAIGKGLANRLVESASQIIHLGIKDPAIFELLGLFEEGFGPDRLSDLAIRIIKDDILAYTARIVRKIGFTNVVEVTSSAGNYLLPVGPDGESIKLLPQALLRDLPVASDWSEIAKVVEFNAALRNQINQIISSIFRQGRKPTKRDVRAALFRSPSQIEALLAAYHAASPEPYDFSLDPQGLLAWYAIGSAAAKAAPMRLRLSRNPTIDEIEGLVGEIVRQFKRHIENHGLHAHLFNDDGKKRHERFAQLLLFAVADDYCRSNDLDISREPNGRNGPVDFKVSRGYTRRVLVEVKLSTNPQLLHGYERQLKRYAESEATDRTYYVIIRVADKDTGMKEVLAAEAQAKAAARRAPRVIVIDGRKRASASKRR